MRKTMRRRTQLLALFVSASFLLSQSTAIAQNCQGVGGQWLDNYGYNWNLQQSGNSASGTVSACFGGWSASGSVDQTSGLTLTASGIGCPASSFTYVGSNNLPGCYDGSGTWNNNIGGSGPWNWSKPCDSPSTESTIPIGWNNYPVYQFRGTLDTSGGRVWGGRTVKESPAQSGSDTCYMDGSPTPDDSDGHTLNSTFPPINWLEFYFDYIGIGSVGLQWYQTHTAPCTVTLYQAMSIECSSGVFMPAYKVNVIEIHIYPTAAQMCRDGVCSNTQ